MNNSKLYFGVFLDGQLHGVMSYGPSLDKSKIIGLVDGTGWNEFLELNRMAFDSVLPRNSESRAISMSIRLLKKYAPQVKWIISFADACSCGDGTIYRASNFVLIAIKENLNLAEQSGRHCWAMESNLLYCDLIVRRWEQFTGEKAEKTNAMRSTYLILSGKIQTERKHAF